ncbi:MAG: beta-lactamase family protein [Bacteroidota bacterium]|nr:beta-lactamase family protein [Bacteroidota bacterium]
MKKFFKRFGLFLLLILVVANLFILFTGRTYLYKGVWNTYLKGRKGPSPLEYAIFENREVKNGTPQPWLLGKDYNKKEIPANLLDSMMRLETGAFLIIKDDSIRCEKYWGEFTDHSMTNSFSMAKTVVSVLTGCAIKDGFIKNVDQPVSDFIPEFKNGDRSKVTIRHLLNMSSGLNFDEDYVNPLAYPAESYYGSDLRKLTFGYTEVIHPPGETFRYLSGNTQLLGFLLNKATGKTLADYASEKLWKPMGCEHPAFWSLDHKDGDEKAFCCLNSNARDFARIGKLYLDSGRWEGNQIVPQEYVFESIEPCGTKHEDGTPALDYGFNWWMIPQYGGHHIFYARGILGQYVIMVPDMNMIIVRLGNKRLPGESNQPPRDMYYYLDAAFAMYK